jgi:hypothetical protein
MRAVLMAIGAFLLGLGSVMIATHQFFFAYGFYEAPLGANLSIYFVYSGLVLIPIGAAILAYGVGSTNRTEM